MEVRTFRASSLQEALRQVRETLGPDASVLHTREIKKSRLGLFARSEIEVEASLDVPVASRFAKHSSVAAHAPAPNASRKTIATAQPHTSTAPSEVEPIVEETLATRPRDPQSSPLPSSPATNAPAVEQTQQESYISRSGYRDEQIHSRTATQPPAFPISTSPTSSVAGPTKLPGISSAAMDIISDLMDFGIDSRVAKELIQEATERCSEVDREDPWMVQVSLNQSVAKRLNVSGSIEIDADEQKVVALVGSTGVGKTTTLAKIAAGFRFDLGCQVGLITLDTFRLGAVDQLLQYAELISAPLEVVSSPDEVTAALGRLRECDLVLLDTAGRSPRDAGQLRVLAQFLEKAQPDSTHLVVSASSSRRHIEDTLANFDAVNPTNLLITKLDEAVDFGAWLPVLCESHLPVSYLTTGQHVPQDIVVASPRRLARELLGGDLRHQERSREEAQLRRSPSNAHA